MPEKTWRTRLRQLKRKMSLETGRDITYQDIANETGLSYQTVHRYATKVIPRPDYETVVTLAKFFGVPVEELILETESGNEEDSAMMAVV